jgi:hypothetical protein
MIKKKSKFIFLEKLLNPFNIYLKIQNIFNNFPNSSVIYKQSVGKYLIRHFFGYHGHLVNAKTGNIGSGWLHYSQIIALKPESILCIGSQNGFVPAICALACKDNNKGLVHFVDAGKKTGEKSNWGGVGFWKTKLAKNHFNVLGINKHLKLHVMTSKKFFNKYKNKKFEYIWIDGDHSFEGVNFDYSESYRRLISGGVIGLHDIALKGLFQGEEYGVHKLWKKIKNNKYKFINGNSSIGFVQKN